MHCSALYHVQINQVRDKSARLMQANKPVISRKHSPKIYFELKTNE